MWNRIKRWWQAQGALVGLQSLDDRLLADMGLERQGLRDRVLGRSEAARAVSDSTPALVAACRC